MFKNLPIFKVFMVIAALAGGRVEASAAAPLVSRAVCLAASKLVRPLGQGLSVSGVAEKSCYSASLVPRAALRLPGLTLLGRGVHTGEGRSHTAFGLGMTKEGARAVASESSFAHVVTSAGAGTLSKEALCSQALATPWSTADVIADPFGFYDLLAQRALDHPHHELSEGGFYEAYLKRWARSDVLVEPLRFYGKEYSGRSAAASISFPYPEMAPVVERIGTLRRAKLRNQGARAREIASDQILRLVAETQAEGFLYYQVVNLVYIWLQEQEDHYFRNFGSELISEKQEKVFLSEDPYQPRRDFEKFLAVGSLAPLYFTFSDLSVEDLNRLNGSPLVVVGLVSKMTKADTQWHSPLEFADHDLDHARPGWKGTKFETHRGFERFITLKARARNEELQKRMIAGLNRLQAENPALAKAAELFFFELTHEEGIQTAEDFLLSPKAFTKGWKASFIAEKNKQGYYPGFESVRKDDLYAAGKALQEILEGFFEASESSSET